MKDESYIVIFSVCVTGLVSILGILIPAYLEWRKLKLQKLATKIDRIYEKAGNLSLSLAKFRNIGYLKEQKKDMEARIELRANHDAWEMAIFSELNNEKRNTVRDMRKNYYGFHQLTGKNKAGEDNVMTLIDNVVEFSCSAIESLNSSTMRKIINKVC